MEIRLATPEIQRDSIVDGEGIRSIIWTQGCRHHCPGCHNPETHSFTTGFLLDTEEIKQKIKALEAQDGITFSGGDPMEQATACTDIAKFCKSIGLNVWCYTGYTFEELLKKAKIDKSIKDFLENIDVLVDGRFMLSEKSYDVIFRGSKNQRLIDVPKSLKKNKVVLVEKFENSLQNQKGRKNHYMYV
ncbi:MAG: anaerobic ribonucleoside-triphosphate reductase activating protein [Erysipelotrichaceae bacterium]|nr:anaerobic ribonucleoside-triphosphate reductase activating protein [Erysipelotrichaceae bacterium]